MHDARDGDPAASSESCRQVEHHLRAVGGLGLGPATATQSQPFGNCSAGDVEDGRWLPEFSWFQFT